MRIKLSVFITNLLFCSIIFISCSSEIKEEPEKQINTEEVSQDVEQQIDELETVEEEEEFIPEESQQISEFPWDDV